jgi:hypothetical protein
MMDRDLERDLERKLRESAELQGRWVHRVLDKRDETLGWFVSQNMIPPDDEITLMALDEVLIEIGLLSEDILPSPEETP